LEVPHPPPPPELKPAPEPSPKPEIQETPEDRKKRYINDVCAVLPDICPEYLSELYDAKEYTSSEKLVQHILDKGEDGQPYRKAAVALKSLKRKRPVDELADVVNKYSLDRQTPDQNYKDIALVPMIP
jgi:hypothetical protein